MESATTTRKDRKFVNTFMKAKMKKKKLLTDADRLLILQDYERIGNQKGVLAALHDCTEAQIANIIRDKDIYLRTETNQTDSKPIISPKIIKRIRPRRLYTSERVVIGAVAYEWVKRMRNCRLNIHDETLRDVAESASKLIKYNVFRATDAWISRFKKKYRLRYLYPYRRVAPLTEDEKQSLKVRNILMEFKNQGPPEHLPAHYLTDIEIRKPVNKKAKSRQAEIRIKRLLEESDWSDGYATSSTRTNDFLTAMQIDDDDDDEEEPVFDDDFTTVENTDGTTNPGTTNGSTTDTYEPGEVTFGKGAISSYKQALEYLRPLENFALMEEDVMALKRLSKLSSLFQEELLSSFE